jgi:hypothetical protein
LEELIEIAKTGEVFRKYPKNPKLSLAVIADGMEKIKANIEVSNKGRVKIDGKMQPAIKKDDGEVYVWLQEKMPDYLLYRLVAETRCEFPDKEKFDEDKWGCHHIFDNENHFPENLIWMKWTDHRKIH